MEGLLPAAGSAIQLVLEHLWGALLVISESLRHVPAPPAFVWEMLIYSVVLVLKIKRQHTLRSVKAPGERCSACDEVCGKGRESTGPMTEADDTVRPPGVEASPPTLQMLCLSTINTNPSRSSLQAAVRFLEEVRKSQPPKPSRGTDEKPILKASAKDGGQLQKKITDALNENTHFPESVEWLKQEIVRWKQTVQEKEEEIERLGRLKARMKLVLKDRLSQFKSLAESLLQTILSPALLGDRVDGGNPDNQQERGAEPGDQSSHPSAGDVKGTTDDADFSVPLQRPGEERQGRARQLREEEQRNEKLVEQITTEEASLQQENSSLESEIQQLKRKLQILPESHEDHLTPFQKKLLEVKSRCLEIEKKLPSVYGDMNPTYQIRSLYKNMTQDRHREEEGNAAYTGKEIVFHARRARESGVAAELTTRKLEDLRRENDHTGQMPATVESTARPFPSSPSATPPAAPRGPEVWGDPWGHQVPRQGGGSRSEIWGQLQVHSAHSSWVLNPRNHAEHLPGCC